MYIRHETRHCPGQHFRDNWGGSSSNEGGSSTSDSGAGEGSTGGGGGSSLGGISTSSPDGTGSGGGSLASQYAAYGEGRQLAESISGYGVATSPQSDWSKMLETSPSFGTTAKLALGVFSNPIFGMFNAVKLNSNRLASMSEAEINNERNVRAQIDAINAAGRGGSGGNSKLAYGGLQFANAKSSGTVSSVGAIPSGSGAIAGATGGGAADNGAATGGATAGSGGAGAGGGLIVAGESKLARLAALATIGALAYQLMG